MDLSQTFSCSCRYIVYRWLLVASFFLISSVQTLEAQQGKASAPASTAVSPAEIPPKQEQLDLQQRLESVCRQASLPAIWAGKFYADGRPPVQAVAGVRRWLTDDPAQIDDVVHLGSCTKAMTAVLIGQLCTEGKLSLETTLSEVYKGSPIVRQSDWGQVTIQELLQHRSGAPANFLYYHAFDTANRESVVDARQALLESLCQKPRPRRPRFEYSNIGYIVLGHVAETLEERSWEELITVRLFNPLKIQSAGFGPVGKPDGMELGKDFLPEAAWGHTKKLSLFGAAKSLLGGDTEVELVSVQLDNARCLGPAGRAHMNLLDWSKFTGAIAAENGNAKLGISDSIWRQLYSVQPNQPDGEEYAAGWMLFNKREWGGRAFFHNGSNTTWYCYAVVVPTKRLTILVATNVFHDEARKACDDVARLLNRQESE